MRNLTTTVTVNCCCNLKPHWKSSVNNFLPSSHSHVTCSPLNVRLAFRFLVLLFLSSSSPPYPSLTSTWNFAIQQLLHSISYRCDISTSSNYADLSSLTILSWDSQFSVQSHGLTTRQANLTINRGKSWKDATSCIISFLACLGESCAKFCANPLLNFNKPSCHPVQFFSSICSLPRIGNTIHDHI